MCMYACMCLCMRATKQLGPLGFIPEGGAVGRVSILTRKAQSTWRALAGPACMAAPLPVLMEGLLVWFEKTLLLEL